MVHFRTCEHCNYTTHSKSSFDGHLASKRHQDNLTETKRPEEPKHLECKYCKKKYASRSGLWAHELKCKTTSQVVVPTEVLSQINERLERIEGTSQANNGAIVPVTNTTNNTLNNTNNLNVNIHTNRNLEYLNKNYGNAMNMSDFMRSVDFNMRDFNTIDNNKNIVQGARKVLVDKFSKIKEDERPMHCIPPETNKPGVYYVRENDTWTEECQSIVLYLLEYGEFERGECRLMTVNCIDVCNFKMYDTYIEKLKKNKNDKVLKNIKNKMDLTGQSNIHIPMAIEISEEPSLTLNIPPDTIMDDAAPAPEALPTPDVSNN